MQGQLPAPPAFYHLYTESPTARAPPKPVTGLYHVFGQEYDTERPLVRSLEDMGHKALVERGGDTIAQLKSLNTSILFNFLQLLDILSECPEQSEQKLHDIDLLFANMHHLVNTYRPFEGLETIKQTMEQQLQRHEKLIHDIRHVMEKTHESLTDVATTIAEVLAQSPDVSSLIKEQQ